MVLVVCVALVTACSDTTPADGGASGADAAAATAPTRAATAPSTTVRGADLVGLLEAAVLDTSWPCGNRYAISSSDQTVGLIVDTRGLPYEPAVVELPDERFETVVMVGTDLFAHNCDDVVTIEPVVEARWPIALGRFEHRPPTELEVFEEACGPRLVASIELVDAVVSTPLGDRELAPITITNRGYGCFVP